MVALVITFRTQLMGLFTDNPYIIGLGASVLLLSVLLETGRTMNIVIINSLRAAGDAKYPVLIGAFSMVLMSLPLGYFFRLSFRYGARWYLASNRHRRMDTCHYYVLPLEK